MQTTIPASASRLRGSGRNGAWVEGQARHQPLVASRLALPRR